MTRHKKAEWAMDEHKLPDGSCIDHYGNVGYVENKKRHRVDGPAVEWDNGTKEWYVDDKEYRTKEEYEEALKTWKMN